MRVLFGRFWKTNFGYGRCSYNGREQSTHRIAYQLVYGDIPEGLLVLHSCDNPPCFNPYHVSPGTQKENIQDSVSKGRMHFGESNGGVKLTPEAVYLIRESTLSQSATGALFGISQTQVWKIKQRKKWRLLPER